jgi:hypothetical protein
VSGSNGAQEVDRTTKETDFLRPRELKARLEETAAALPRGAFIRDPRQQHLKDIWCAAHFGIGYERHVEPCKVRVNTEQNSDTDFILRIKKGDFPFQTTLADVPGRKMGDEHSPNRDAASLMPYQPGRGSAEGSEWIKSAICRKRAARYSDASTLNLLVYANFSTNGLDYETVKRIADEPAGAFGSVWVVTNHQISSVGRRGLCGYLDGFHLIYPPEEWSQL